MVTFTIRWMLELGEIDSSSWSELLDFRSDFLIMRESHITKGRMKIAKKEYDTEHNPRTGFMFVLNAKNDDQNPIQIMTTSRIHRPAEKIDSSSKPFSFGKALVVFLAIISDYLS